jgi:hypothetical protein
MINRSIRNVYALIATLAILAGFGAFLFVPILSVAVPAVLALLYGGLVILLVYKTRHLK